MAVICAPLFVYEVRRVPVASAARSVMHAQPYFSLRACGLWCCLCPCADIAFSNSRPNDLLVAYTPVASATTPNGGYRHTEAKIGGDDGGVDGIGVEDGLRTLSSGGLLCLWDLNDVSAPRMYAVGPAEFCIFSPSFWGWSYCRDSSVCC